MSIPTSERLVIEAVQAQHNFDDLFQRASQGELVIVEKEGSPAVAMISIAEYETLIQRREQAEQEERLRRFEQAARAIGEEVERLGITEEQMMEELEKTREEVYREFYGNKG